MRDVRYKPGDPCGPFTVVRFLRSGGMGDVYEAKHRSTGVPAALKCLRARYRGHADMAMRMKREAKLLAKIQHRNIVTVFDAGMDGETLWMAMELLEGRTLRELLRATGRLTIPDALYIAREIADGADAAHEFNAIHRDLKPENIFITASREVKLLDFGIAKLYGYTDDLHSTGRVSTIGTPHYMSPEHLRGEKVDVRTDIYALGLILYEMLFGRHVFARDGQVLSGDQIARMHLYCEPEPPPGSREGFRDYVWRIIELALAKDRDGRYASMADVARDLRGAGRRALAEGETSRLMFGAASAPRRSGHELRSAQRVEIEPDAHAESAVRAFEEQPSPPRSGPQSFWKTRPRPLEQRQASGDDETLEMPIRRELDDGEPAPIFAALSAHPPRSAERGGTLRLARAPAPRESVEQSGVFLSPANGANGVNGVNGVNGEQPVAMFTVPLRSVSPPSAPWPFAGALEASQRDASVLPTPGSSWPRKLNRWALLALVLGPTTGAAALGALRVFGLSASNSASTVPPVHAPERPSASGSSEPPRVSAGPICSCPVVPLPSPLPSPLLPPLPSPLPSPSPLSPPLPSVARPPGKVPPLPSPKPRMKTPPSRPSAPSRGRIF